MNKLVTYEQKPGLVRARSPLRIGLAGGGTDVPPYCDIYGGRVLNYTIGLYTYCTINVLDEKKVVFESVDLAQSYESTVGYFKLDGKFDLYKAVYNRVVQDYNHGEHIFVHVTTYSDVPKGSGLGGSSSLVVSMLKAFCELLNISIDKYQLARVAHQIERNDIGISGGVQDQFASVFGGLNIIENQGEEINIISKKLSFSIKNQLENSLLLYYTGITRESAKVITEQASNVQQNDLSLQSLHRIKLNVDFITEAIEGGQIRLFSKYLLESWEAKRSTSPSISTEYIDKIYSVALMNGALAGKVSGAGGGGFMLFVIDSSKTTQITSELDQFGGRCYKVPLVEHGVQSWRVR